MRSSQARTFLRTSEKAFCRAVSRLAFCNPFLPERIENEREALGPDFVDAGPVWSERAGQDLRNPNLPRLGDRSAEVLEGLREKLAAGAAAAPDELGLYQDLVLYLLYHRYEDGFWELIVAPPARLPRPGFYADYLRDFERFFSVPGVDLPERYDPAHLFACFFQLRRAFHHIFRNIVGASTPTARLRATVWQSIFTHDMRRYRRSLFERMGDIPTLITGPTGTGKELVARAIGLSRYVPFDPAKLAFGEDVTSFRTLNLSALSPTLIESELFGHRKGSFTGALEDRVGWLEACPPGGTIFLDEIGELEGALQVKLLRVLQGRTFQRIGETADRRFLGKIIAATNRDLARDRSEGRFRDDLYYRLCSDRIVTPSLREQLADSPGDLRFLVGFIVRRLVAEDEVETISAEASTWIERNLGRSYAWPGNVRELEQCVRSLLVRQEYLPWAPPAATPEAELVEAISSGTISAEELVARYCSLIYARTGSYQETARRLGLDRRTVKARIDAVRDS